MSGHGIGGAIITAALQASLRSLSAQPTSELSATVQILNRSMCDISANDFYATLFYAEIDPFGHRLRYVSAGYESALLFHQRSSRVRRLQSTGTVLGLTAHGQFREQTVSVEPGDALVAFTDGVTETTGLDGIEFREDGVRRVLEQHSRATALEIASHIMEATDRLRGSSSATDDRTVVVARLISPEARQPTCSAAELALAALALK